MIVVWLVVDERLLVFAMKVLSRLGQFRLKDISRGKPSVTMTGKVGRHLRETLPVLSL